VIGGEDVEKIASTLRMLITILQIKVPHTMNESRDPTFEPEFLARGYIPCGDKEINQLATKNSLASRLYEKWALYPDHVVFLGAEASILDRSFDSSDLDSVVTTRPPFIFSIGNCVFESQQVTLAQKVQLRCYYDVISRQSNFKELTTLNKGQIFEILNWDAEKYRQKAPSD
jgi:rhamnose utilization protein RhaD (predicted bifunctional aldolase and dehydrogenase)